MKEKGLLMTDGGGNRNEGSLGMHQIETAVFFYSRSGGYSTTMVGTNKSI
jgi:hypothetical protein